MLKYPTSSNGIPDITTEKWQETGWMRVTAMGQQVGLNPRVLQWGHSLCTWGAHSDNWAPSAFPSMANALIPSAWCRVHCVVLLHPTTAPNLSRSISYCCLADTVLILSFCLQFCDSTMGEYNWNEPHRHRVLYFENWTDVLCCFWVWLPGLVCSVKLKLTWCILSGKPHLGHFCLVEGLE